MIIPDGYNFNGVLNRKNGQIRFVYRPMLYAERKATITAIHHIRGEAAFLLMYEAIGQHVVDWDLECKPEFYLNTMRLNDEETFIRLWDMICGVDGGDGKSGWSESWENDTAANLRAGMKLMLDSPQFANRTCESCQKWWWDDDTGTVYRRGGLKILRPDGQGLLCQTAAGCPRGTPEKQNALDERNQMAYDHFRACQAIDRFPDDMIVARNAVIIKSAIKRHEQARKNGR